MVSYRSTFQPLMAGIMRASGKHAVVSDSMRASGLPGLRRRSMIGPVTSFRGPTSRSAPVGGTSLWAVNRCLGQDPHASHISAGSSSGRAVFDVPPRGADVPEAVNRVEIVKTISGKFFTTPTLSLSPGGGKAPVLEVPVTKICDKSVDAVTESDAVGLTEDVEEGSKSFDAGQVISLQDGNSDSTRDVDQECVVELGSVAAPALVLSASTAFGGLSYAESESSGGCDFKAGPPIVRLGKHLEPSADVTGSPAGRCPEGSVIPPPLRSARRRV